MCVVIGLQSTGEAGTTLARDEQGDEMDDFVSAPKMILYRLIKVSQGGTLPLVTHSHGL